MGVDVSFVDLDSAVSRLKTGLELPPDRRGMTWASRRCVYSRFVHKNIWEARPEKEKVRQIVDLLRETQNAVIRKCFQETNPEAKEKLVMYARNIGLRIINLEENYLQDRPSDFAPDDRLKEEEERVRASVNAGPEHIW